jgi:hypothetical protein
VQRPTNPSDTTPALLQYRLSVPIRQPPLPPLLLHRSIARVSSPYAVRRRLASAWRGNITQYTLPSCIHGPLLRFQEAVSSSSHRRMASPRPETRLRPEAAEFVMPPQSLSMSSRSRGSPDALLDDAANLAQPRNLTKSQHQQLKNTLKRLGCEFVHVDALLVAHNERVRPRYRICSVDAITQYVAHKAFSPENKHWDFRGGVWVRFVPQQSDKSERGFDAATSPGDSSHPGDADMAARSFASLEGLTAGQIACRDDDDLSFGWGAAPPAAAQRSFEFSAVSGSFALPPPVDAPSSLPLQSDTSSDARSPLFHRGPVRMQRSDSGRSRSSTADAPSMTQVAHMIWGTTGSN